MTIMTAATAFWLAVTPQIGIDTGSPGENLMSYGGTIGINLGALEMQIDGAMTPFEDPEDPPNSWLENIRIKNSNIGVSVWYPMLFEPLTFKLGTDYRMSRTNYYRFEGTPTVGYQGEDYLRFDHSVLVAGKVGFDNLIGGKGPSISIWSGFGPAYVASEGREWRWPSDPQAPVEVTSLVGNALTIDAGFGAAVMQPLFPHFAISGSADFRVKIAKVSGDEIPGTSGSQLTAYIGPTLYF